MLPKGHGEWERAKEARTIFTFALAVISVVLLITEGAARGSAFRDWIALFNAIYFLGAAALPKLRNHELANIAFWLFDTFLFLLASGSLYYVDRGFWFVFGIRTAHDGHLVVGSLINVGIKMTTISILLPFVMSFMGISQAIWLLCSGVTFLATALTLAHLGGIEGSNSDSAVAFLWIFFAGAITLLIQLREHLITHFHEKPTHSPHHTVSIPPGHPAATPSTPSVKPIEHRTPTPTPPVQPATSTHSPSPSLAITHSPKYQPNLFLWATLAGRTVPHTEHPEQLIRTVLTAIDNAPHLIDVQGYRPNLSTFSIQPLLSGLLANLQQIAVTRGVVFGYYLEGVFEDAIVSADPWLISWAIQNVVCTFLFNSSTGGNIHVTVAEADTNLSPKLNVSVIVRPTGTAHDVLNLLSRTRQVLHDACGGDVVKGDNSHALNFTLDYADRLPKKVPTICLGVHNANDLRGVSFGNSFTDFSLLLKWALEHNSLSTVVVLDYSIGEQSGPALCHKLRTQGFIGSIIGIASDAFERVEFVEAGAGRTLLAADGATLSSALNKTIQDQFDA